MLHQKSCDISEISSTAEANCKWSVDQKDRHLLASALSFQQTGNTFVAILKISYKQEIRSVEDGICPIAEFTSP